MAESQKRLSHSWEIPTQRYAYDFVILDENGKSFCGEETEPSSFYCYGKDILAPADGVVAEIGTGILTAGLRKKEQFPVMPRIFGEITY